MLCFTVVLSLPVLRFYCVSSVAVDLRLLSRIDMHDKRWTWVVDWPVSPCTYPRHARYPAPHLTCNPTCQTADLNKCEYTTIPLAFINRSPPPRIVRLRRFDTTLFTMSTRHLWKGFLLCYVLVARWITGLYGFMSRAVLGSAL